MRVLITGGGGFLASHLVSYIQTIPSIEIRSLSRSECDLARDSGQLAALLQSFQPERIFHLAGRTNGSKADLYRDNLQATSTLLAAVKSLPRTRIVLTSTTAVYGAGGSADAPLREDQRPAPKGDYAMSKHEAEQLALTEARAGADLMIGRISNPIGAGMSPEFVCGAVARQIVDIERGAKKEVVLRSLSPKRDFLGVRDCVRALWCLMEKGESGGIYNVAAGTSIAIAEIVNVFLNLARVRPIEVVNRESANERSTIQEQWISNSRIISLGWRQEGSLQQVIADLLEAERQRA
jgi:nucleoside-diphosphate-sugar epimerase